MSENIFSPVLISIEKSDSGKNYTQIGGSGNPWNDLFVIGEGLGLLMRILEKNGVTEHNGLPLREYINTMIDKAYQASSFVGVIGEE